MTAPEHIARRLSPAQVAALDPERASSLCSTEDCQVLLRLGLIALVDGEGRALAFRPTVSGLVARAVRVTPRIAAA